MYHLLQVLFGVHLWTTVIALGGEGGFGLYTSSLQLLEEHLSLTVGYYAILITMENDDGGIVRVYIVVSTQTNILVGLLGKFRIKQHILR